MARIVQQGVITTSGTSYENEPIIKSDGAGEVMQWQPSDGAADGVFMVEGGSAGDPMRLGIGVAAPDKLLHLSSGDGTSIMRVSDTRTSMTTGDIGQIEFETFDSGSAGVGGYILGEAGGTGGEVDLAFGTGVGGSAVERLRISSAGAVTIPATGSFTIGSLDIGHGLGGDTGSTAVGDGALESSLAGSVGNTAIGGLALDSLNHADADYNTAVGYGCMNSLTTGQENTAMGVSALAGALATGGDHNVAVGRNALNAFGGSNATAVGSGAADVAGGQLGLTAVGKDALGAATSGNSNTAVGFNCLDGTVSGANNTAVGAGTLSAVCVSDNTAVGQSALIAFAGSNATAVGSGAAGAATSATNLAALGKNALGG